MSYCFGCFASWTNYVEWGDEKMSEGARAFFEEKCYDRPSSPYVNGRREHVALPPDLPFDRDEYRFYFKSRDYIFALADSYWHTGFSSTKREVEDQALVRQYAYDKRNPRKDGIYL